MTGAQKISLDTSMPDRFRTSSTPLRGASSAGDAGQPDGLRSAEAGRLPDSDHQPATRLRSASDPIPVPYPDRMPTVADVLLRSGIWVLDRGRRDDLAAQLVTSGWSAADIGMVADRTLRSAGTPRIGVAMLMRLLRDQDRLRAAIEDCRSLGRWEEGSTRRWHPGEMDRIRSAERLASERRVWADDDLTAWVRCRGRDGVAADVAEAEWKNNRSRNP